MEFITSTHNKKWIISLNELTKKYQIANKRAMNALYKYGTTKVQIQHGGILVYVCASEYGENERTSALPLHLSVEEELLLQRYSMKQIQQFCKAFSFPKKIQITSIMFFKRFYQRWSIMEHNPIYIMYTCIFLACKVEDHYISVEKLGIEIGIDFQIFLHNEMILLQTLEFEFTVDTPHRFIGFFINDLKTFLLTRAPSGLQALQMLATRAGINVDNMMLTDVVVLYPPAQLAFAALWTANQEDPKVDFDGYLHDLQEKEMLPLSCSELMAKVDAIELVVNETKHLSEDEVKPIDRRRRDCRNPGLRKLKPNPRFQ